MRSSYIYIASIAGRRKGFQEGSYMCNQNGQNLICLEALRCSFTRARALSLKLVSGISVASVDGKTQIWTAKPECAIVSVYIYRHLLNVCNISISEVYTLFLVSASLQKFQNAAGKNQAGMITLRFTKRCPEFNDIRSVFHLQQ